MNFFKIRKRNKKGSNEIPESIELPINLDIESKEKIVFSSDIIVDISNGGFIDTSDELTIQKYISNLKILYNQVLEKGYVDKFKLIRDDDFFPSDFEWYVNSKNTAIEFSGSNFSYAIRDAIARKEAGVKENLFGVYVSSKAADQILSNLDKNIGRILLPVSFRSTKHFTINTPLGYTHDYNFVESNRRFTIIDDIDNFINSGYAYSLSYNDAYLDITHESLPISTNAVILISKEVYDNFSKCELDMLNSRGSRKLVIYTGDESLAINMLLTEMGVLPSKIEYKYLKVDNRLSEILENSIRKFANENNIDYNIWHGNLNGRGGHFSDYFDSYNVDNQMKWVALLNFLKNELPDFEFDERMFSDLSLARKFVSNVGVDKLLNLLDKYNLFMQQDIINRYSSYKKDRESIDKETSDLFKYTLSLIKKYYSKNELFEFSSVDINNLNNNICAFFHSDTVSQQKAAAIIICEILEMNYVSENPDVSVNYTR